MDEQESRKIPSGQFSACELSDQEGIPGRRFLAIDNHWTVFRGFKEQIEEEQGSVDIVSSVTDAKRLLAVRTYDGVVCDATVEALNDGVKFLERLARSNEHKGLRLVLYSGRKQDRYLFPADGLDGFGRDWRNDFTNDDHYYRKPDSQKPLRHIAEGPAERIPQNVVVVDKTVEKKDFALLYSALMGPKPPPERSR